MQGSDYGRAKLPEEAFKELLGLCSADPSKYPYSYTPGAPTAPTTPTTTAEPTASPTCGGTKYTVKENDNCESISLANSVATDRMVDVNHLDYNCTTLATGQSLCIKDTCKLATIKMNQTCDDIVRDTGFSVYQLASWNPFVTPFLVFNNLLI